MQLENLERQLLGYGHLSEKEIKKMLDDCDFGTKGKTQLLGTLINISKRIRELDRNYKRINDDLNMKLELMEEDYHAEIDDVRIICPHPVVKAEVPFNGEYGAKYYCKICGKKMDTRFG